MHTAHPFLLTGSHSSLLTTPHHSSPLNTHYSLLTITPHCSHLTPYSVLRTLAPRSSLRSFYPFIWGMSGLGYAHGANAQGFVNTYLNSTARVALPKLKTLHNDLSSVRLHQPTLHPSQLLIRISWAGGQARRRIRRVLVE